jgi:hypothetical protein
MAKGGLLSFSDRLQPTDLWIKPDGKLGEPGLPLGLMHLSPVLTAGQWKRRFRTTL